MKYLQQQGIRVTPEFVDDIKKLVQTDFKNFAKNILKDLFRKQFEDYNRFEKLSLNAKQKNRIKGNILWRYEYRNTSNLKCIFIVKNDNNTDIPIIICAFNEDGDKKKGKGSYNDNIERAISIIEKYNMEGDENGLE